jgi:hypothetical protein
MSAAAIVRRGAAVRLRGNPGGVRGNRGGVRGSGGEDGDGVRRSSVSVVERANDSARRSARARSTGVAEDAPVAAAVVAGADPVAKPSVGGREGVGGPFHSSALAPRRTRSTRTSRSQGKASSDGVSASSSRRSDAALFPESIALPCRRAGIESSAASATGSEAASVFAAAESVGPNTLQGRVSTWIAHAFTADLGSSAVLARNVHRCCVPTRHSPKHALHGPHRSVPQGSFAPARDGTATAPDPGIERSLGGRSDAPALAASRGPMRPFGGSGGYGIVLFAARGPVFGPAAGGTRAQSASKKARRSMSACEPTLRWSNTRGCFQFRHSS